MAMPIRVRLTLWYVALLGVILIVLSVVLVVSLRTELTRSLDRTLQASANEIAVDYAPQAGKAESEFRDVTDASLAGLPRDASAVQVITSGGTVLVNAGNHLGSSAMLPAAEIASAAAGNSSVGTDALGGTDYRVRAVPFAHSDQPSALVVATSLEPIENAIGRLTLLLGLLIPIGLALAALGGWWLARKALRPVASMTDEAAAIDAAQLDARVGVPATMDELGRLALTLNAMLDRIRSAVGQQRAFVSDASHELRTPLAIMRAEIDVSLGAPELSEDARATLLSAREETDRMRAIVEDLLLLARMDEGGLALEEAVVDLRALAAEAVQAFRPLAEDRHIELTLVDGEPTIVLADAVSLQRAVRNLLDNAIKYSPPGSDVIVSVHGDQEQGQLTVADTGVGIPPEELPKVFERFHRVDPSRGRGAGGSGLGLAIVRELVEAQGGRVRAESSPGIGTSISCTLPAARDERQLERRGASQIPPGR